MASITILSLKSSSTSLALSSQTLCHQDNSTESIQLDDSWPGLQVVDTDPGVDDTLGLLLALASPEIEILAITICFGNTDLEACWLNVLKIFDVLERHLEQHPQDRARFPNYSDTGSIYLAKGSRMPLEGELHKAEYFHGRDGLCNISSRHPELNLRSSPPPLGGESRMGKLLLTDESAWSLSLRLIAEQPTRAMTYIALGPLTNLARMIRENGSLVRERLGRVVSMGGALDVPGNTAPCAEFNFYADPYAVREILGSASSEPGFSLERFLFLPLDTTTRHELPMPRYTSVIDDSFRDSSIPSRLEAKPLLTHFTSSFLERTREVMISFGKDAVELHDPVAVWCACMNPPTLQEIDPPGLSAREPAVQSGWTWAPRIFDIERTGELTRGMLVVDRRDDNILAEAHAYEPGANRSEVQAMLYEGMTSKNIAVAEGAEGADETARIRNGVPCVVDTPGPEALLSLMFQRIWGVTRAQI